MSDVNDQGVTQDTSATDSSPVENNTPEVADNVNDLWGVESTEVKDEPKAETEEQPKPDEEGQPEETPAEEQPRGKAEERKQQLNTEIRGLVEQRKALREEVEKLHSTVYQPQTVEELKEEGMDETRAMVESLKQERDLERYNNQVVEAQLGLEEQSARVFKEFTMFDPMPDESGKPTNPDYDPEVAAQAAEALDAVLIRDPNTGQIIGSHVSPYKIYKPIADAYRKSRVEGQVKGQQAAERQMANVDPSPSASHQKKADPLMDLWST